MYFVLRPLGTDFGRAPCRKTVQCRAQSARRPRQTRQHGRGDFSRLPLETRHGARRDVQNAANHAAQTRRVRPLIIMDESFFDSDTDDDEEDKDPAHQANDFFQSLKPSSLSQPQPWDPSNNSPQLLEAQPSDQTQPVNRTSDLFRSLKGSPTGQDDSTNAEATPEIIPGLRSGLSRGQPAPTRQVSAGAPAATGVPQAAAPTAEIIPGLRAADSPVQPGANAQFP